MILKTKLKNEIENWKWKLKLEIEIENWKLKLKTEIENWNWIHMTLNSPPSYQ